MLRMGYYEYQMSQSQFAKQLLEEASVAGAPSVFAATGHSTNNISIAHQQVRCVNLAWALLQAKKVRHGSVVAIVGGSLSGLMLAVALAAQRRCIVYVVEKEQRLLHNLRSAPFRFVSPNLNTRDLPTRYDPETSISFADKIPLFQWRADSANEVAHQWLREFKEYAEHLPIFTLTDAEVVGRQNIDGDRVSLKVRLGKREIDLPADVAILATGFGQEQNALGVEDWSYWQAGSPLQYMPDKVGGDRPRVIIAGCGDSGVIELVHHVFRGFRHEHLPLLYPHGVESFVQGSLEQSQTRNIRNEEQNYEFDELISELGWFFNCKDFKEANPAYAKDALCDDNIWAPVERQKAYLIERITRELLNVGVDAAANLTEEGAYRSLVQSLTELSKEKQLIVRKAVEPDIAALASIEFELIMKQLDLKEYIRSELRPDVLLNAFDITLVDTTPTPYTERLSPINLAYLKLCQDAQPIEYRQGRLNRVEQLENGLIAHFDEGEPIRCDRILTRFGVEHTEVSRNLLGKPAPRFHHGDYLLTSPDFSNGNGYNDVALEQLERALTRRRRERRGREPKWWAPRGIFMAARFLPEGQTMPEGDDFILLDEGELVEKLKAGTRIKYDDFSNRPL